MKPHKWAKEIKAWADGVKVYGRMDTHKSIIAEFEVTELSQFDTDNHSFYIKPIPKEPQYLYVYKRIDGSGMVWDFSDSPNDGHPQWKCVGKIKLEQDDETI